MWALLKSIIYPPLSLFRLTFHTKTCPLCPSPLTRAPTAATAPWKPLRAALWSPQCARQVSLPRFRPFGLCPTVLCLASRAHRRYAPFSFGSGDDVSAVVDRRTHSGNGSNGVVRFLRNGKALMAEAEPLLPIEFAEEAVLVMSFGLEGGSAKIVNFE